MSPELNSVVTLHDKQRDLRHGEMPTLGQLVYLTKKDKQFLELIKPLSSSDWLIRDFVPALEKLGKVRNKAAHDERVDLLTAAEWRNSLLGVGCPGLLEQFAKVRPKRGVAVRPPS
jgi:hypothetical protein